MTDDTIAYSDDDIAALHAMLDHTVRVPHKARYSFDLVHCVCGWYNTHDDQEWLRVWGEAHDEAHAGQYVEMEEFEPGRRDA